MSARPANPMNLDNGPSPAQIDAGLVTLTHTGQRQDPYLTWAGETEGRYLVGDPKGNIRLAGVLLADHRLEDVVKAVNISGTRFAARSILGTRYFSAQMASASNTACRALLRYADYVLAEPGMWPVDKDKPSGADGSGHGAVPIPRGSNRQPRVATCPQSLVIGVIDGLCGFANQCFCVDSKSTLDFYWDQAGDPAQAQRTTGVPRWSRPADFNYGRELSGDALNKIASDLSRSNPDTGQRSDAERALYRLLAHKVPDDADWSHGTHVLDTVLSDAAASRSAKRTTKRPGVVYVQLPESALRDTSARWAAAYVLDAIDYIVSRAAPGAQIVINLSLGAFAGPHDGSSMLERAIDEIIDRHGGRLTVVVAAGNAGRIVDDGTGITKPCHARIALEPAGRSTSSMDLRSASLTWDIDALDTTESFMEIWVPDLGLDADPCGVSLSLQHETLAAMSLDAVAPDQTGTISRGGRVVAMVVNATGKCKVPNGNGGMALVALAHTRDQGAPPAPAGRWTIRITNECNRPLTLDAWIERRDMPGELLGFRPQYGFVDVDHSLTSSGALGTLANGRRTIVVGAVDQDAQSATYRASDYSSEGLKANPDDCNARIVARRGPDVYSAGRRTASGYFSGTTKNLAGTSMAAAQVSGAVAGVAALPTKTAETMLDKLQRFAAARQTSAGHAGTVDPRSPTAPRLTSSGRSRAEFVLPPMKREGEDPGQY